MEPDTMYEDVSTTRVQVDAQPRSRLDRSIERHHERRAGIRVGARRAQRRQLALAMHAHGDLSLRRGGELDRTASRRLRGEQMHAAARRLDGAPGPPR